MSREGFGRALAFAIPLVTAPSAGATEYCIATQQALQALVDQTYGPNGFTGDLHVKLVEGEYEVASPDLTTVLGSLTIEGGYEPGCQVRHPGAQRTVLHDASGTGRPSFHAFGGGDVIVRDLTLSGYGGVFVWPQAIGASVLLQRVAFLFSGAIFNGVESFPSDGDVVLENVLIDAATSLTTQCALRGHSPKRMTLDYVTVINRAAGTGACLGADGDIAVTNSIVLSDGADFEPPVTPTFLLRNSSMAEIPVVLAPGSSGNSIAAIPFEASMAALYRNRPADVATQPARDSGLVLATIPLDLLGENRQRGAAPDRGAFELQPSDANAVFADGFETP